MIRVGAGFGRIDREQLLAAGKRSGAKNPKAIQTRLENLLAGKGLECTNADLFFLCKQRSDWSSVIGVGETTENMVAEYLFHQEVIDVHPSFWHLPEVQRTERKWFEIGGVTSLNNNNTSCGYVIGVLRDSPESVGGIINTRPRLLISYGRQEDCSVLTVPTWEPLDQTSRYKKIR